jgi:hypothetical protein
MVPVVELAITRTATALVAAASVVHSVPMSRTTTAPVMVSSAVHPADRIETRMEPGTGRAYTIAGTRPDKTSACGAGKAPR